jgi:K+/H+ antiporter YhaU regulatory subunit KhtT
MTAIISKPPPDLRKFDVRHERLPGVGDRFAFDTTAGQTVTVVNHRSGRRDIALSEPGAETPLVTVNLSEAEAAAVVALLAGLHIELTTTADGLPRRF